MTVLTEIRTARTHHRCEVCREKILPGQRYERAAFPPKDEIFASNRWDHLAAHAPYGVCRDRAVA